MKIRYFEKRGEVWLDFRDADGKRRRATSGCKTIAQAQKAAPGVIQRLLSPPVENVPAAPPSPTSASKGPTLLDAYRLAHQVRESWITCKSKATLQTTFDGLGLPPDTPVAALTRDYVRELRAEWLKAPGKARGTTLSPSTINHRLSMLSVLLEVCDLPPHTVKHLSTKGNSRTRRVTDAELVQMRSWCAAHDPLKGARQFGALVEVGMLLAARKGELLGLRWADVTEDLVYFRDTKNSETRAVPLGGPAKAILEALRCPGSSGPFDGLTADRCIALWDSMRDAMGLGDDDEFVFHSLRHEAITRMVESGASAFAVQAVAGHASIATTQGYVTRSTKMMRDALGI